LLAALNFVVLTTIAMYVYAEHYEFSFNFLSELGATRTWAGAPNHPSAVLFGLALGGVGTGFIGFAGAWRAFAFERKRARAAGIAAQLFGTASGAAFVAVAVTPVNVALELHNTFVLAAFGLLLCFAASMTILIARNGATLARMLASVWYLLVVAGYVAVVAYAVRVGVVTERGHRLLVVSQKIVAAASMLYIAYFTLDTRSRLQGISTAPAVHGDERGLPR
jgi:hypothetical protein